MATVASATLAVVLAACGGPEVVHEGPEDGALLGASQLSSGAIVVRLADAEAGGQEAGPFDAATVEHDGRDVTADAERTATELRYPLAGLGDGDHEVVVDVPGAGRRTFTFTVDATAPEVAITAPVDGVVVSEGEAVLAGRVDEGGTTVTVDGGAVEVGDDGGFERPLTPEVPSVVVVATDAAGNATEHEVALTWVPSRVAVDEVRGVHVTPHAWATPSFRERIVGMVDDGRINTVQLDLKDESGRIGYDSQVPLAAEIGAVEGVYDLDEAVAELHDRGVHVVGRIVAFRDRVLADHAWDAGERDLVIQTPDGKPYAGYGGFTSFASEPVREYNLAIAEEAAAAGVDAILWDYIRRPDGPAEELLVPGLDPDASGRTMEQAVVDFTRSAKERLAPYGVEHGASVYGIAATRPTQIAQDIPALAEHLDYVAPMLYPSHWGPGEYDVAEPNRQPYDIVHRSLADFQEAVEGTGARVVPWLEDTAYRAYDRPLHVREQIRAASDRGVDEWLMWDPVVGYTVDAYEPR